MAVQMIKRVFGLKLPSNRWQVLVCLCEHASPQGDNCYPAKETVNAETGVSISTIKEILREFRNNGVLYIEKGGRGGRSGANGQGLPTVYSIDMDQAWNVYGPTDAWPAYQNKLQARAEAKRAARVSAQAASIASQGVTKEGAGSAQQGAGARPLENRSLGAGSAQEGAGSAQEGAGSSGPKPSIEPSREPVTAREAPGDDPGGSPGARATPEDIGGPPRICDRWRDEILPVLRRTLSKQVIDNWLEPLAVVADDHKTLVLMAQIKKDGIFVPSKFLRKWVAQNYLDNLQRVARCEVVIVSAPWPEVNQSYADLILRSQELLGIGSEGNNKSRAGGETEGMGVC